jgi:hypothetical protein
MNKNFASSPKQIVQATKFWQLCAAQRDKPLL